MTWLPQVHMLPQNAGVLMSSRSLAAPVSVLTSLRLVLARMMKTVFSTQLLDHCQIVHIRTLHSGVRDPVQIQDITEPQPLLKGIAHPIGDISQNAHFFSTHVVESRRISQVEKNVFVLLEFDVLYVFKGFSPPQCQYGRAEKSTYPLYMTSDHDPL